MFLNAIALAATLAAAATSGAQKKTTDKFAPISVGEGVMYPLPPVPLPALQPAADTSGWTDTQDSPALRVSRAWMKLGQASAVERSDGTKRLFDSWRQEVGRSGSHSKATQAAQARFLASYSEDLRRARKIYAGVIEEVDGMNGEATGSNPDGDAAANAIVRDADEHLKVAERDLLMTDSACFLSPATCVPPDAGDRALEAEIGALVKDTLGAGGPDGSLNVRALRRKAGLLELRARVMLAVTRRAAARVAIDVATQQDGNGAPRALLSPLGPQSRTASTSAYRPSDPYR